MKNDFQRVITNGYIRANNIMLISEDGEKLGVFKKDDAIKKAEEEEKDVIQIGFNSKDNVAVAKLMEFGKFMYQKKKEDAEKRKAQKGKQMKEVKFSYNIGDNDLEMKKEKIEKFLRDGHPVKILGQLRGRENIFANKLYERLESIEQAFVDMSKSQGIKKEKKGYSVVLFAKIKQ
ncbi:translation initiation factor IF-3 [Candidatus Absconditicoccus praedator]|uniref:translation initiation factor IF-3 n=1 Tax=Candidatus Absconditicoccus praedator TaxID=2735562 RepID=UPI001E38F741|nr:translation initiation factor IF-3 [Candidatus Absconditicoccus praedator]UFX82862.1 translation initiation factor IF-3 [Candidatus Absconditicoccus praedator]